MITVHAEFDISFRSKAVFSNMSLEALSHAASAAFPIFEQEKIDVKIAYSGNESDLREFVVSQPSAILPSIPTLSRHSSYSVPSFNLPPKYV